MLGLVTGYGVSLLLGRAVFDPILSAPWFSIPTIYTPVLSLPAIILILPASLVVFVELISLLKVTGTIVGHDLMADPGIERTLLGKGISTVLSGMLGSTPNTTYAENIGVLAITRVYSIAILAGAAVIAILFCGKISAAIQSIPGPVMGTVSLLLFGVITALF